MIKIDRIEERAEEFHNALLRGLKPGHRIRLQDEKFEVFYRTSPTLPAGDACVVPLIEAVVVGIDVREWTRRGIHNQLVLAAILNHSILEAIDMLRNADVFRAGCDPFITSPTGDGAYIVFAAGGVKEKKDHGATGSGKKKTETPKESEAERRARNEAMEKALLLVLTINTLVSEYNARDLFAEKPPKEKDEMEVLPIYPRFAVTMDRILVSRDVGGNRTAIGPAMVSCARILSTDHGNHFLVHDRFLHECYHRGGIDKVVSGAGVGDWDAHFHLTEIPDTQVKFATYRYADVFGHYSDQPLLRMRSMMRSVKPIRYHIGSHDVLRIS